MERHSGAISRQEFERGCKTILNAFGKTLDVEWVEETNSIVVTSAASGYVRATNDARFRRSNARRDTSFSTFCPHDAIDDDTFEDVMATVTMAARCDHIREYRVVYSPTFRVPVMCLRARDASTRAPWTISRLLAQIRAEMRGDEDIHAHDDAAGDDRDPVLTPYENPHERREGAWACVHPCATSDVMRMLLSNAPPHAGDEHGNADASTARYFALWIRFVAREIGLPLATHV